MIPSLLKNISKYGLFLAWIVACIATIGSLGFSEMKNIAPCTLCWYQRIFMFPLCIILGIAAFRKDYHIIPYALPLSLIGTVIALFHFLLQELPHFSLALCIGDQNCSVKSLDYSSIFTVIFSLTSFLIISASLISIASYRHRSKK